MYWLNSFAKATGLRTEETGAETESKSAEINEEPAAADSTKSLDGVQSEGVLDSGNKETLETEKDKVSEGSQLFVGETESRIGEIQSLDTLDNVSAEKELGSLDNVSAEKELGSLDNVSAEKDLGSLDDVLAEKDLGSLDSVLAEKELGSLENVAAEQEIRSLDDVLAEKDLGSLENVSAEKELGSLENVSVEKVLGSLDSVSAEKDLGSLDDVLAEKDLGSLDSVLAEKELGSLENVAAEEEIRSLDDVLAEKDLGSLENVSAEKELGSLENVSVEKVLGSLDSVSAEKEVGLQSEQSKASISVEKSSLEFEEQGAESKDENPENKGLAGEEESVKPRRVESGVSLSTLSKDKDLSMTAEKRHESLISLSIQSCKLGDAESLTGSVMKDQSCQASCSLDGANVNELRKLKEKLAISKKDTETMQKLLEDVRNDYEDLQKSFEKRDREIKKERAESNLKLSKTDGGISSSCHDIPKPKTSELRRKSSELRPKSSELRPKSSELRPKSSEFRPKSSENRRRGAEKSSVTSREKLVESSSLTCPCVTQNIRKIITDVTEDFKEVISAIKKSFAEEREIIGSEFARFKDEYRCALEKKDFEIHAMEETIKGLQARIREGEREADECRKTISLAFAEGEKLHLGIQGLNEELTKAQHEREIRQADLERIKDCLKRYCSAEEYEELQRMDFKFSEVREVEETSDLKTNTDNTDHERKKDKCFTVLRNTKKELKKLKKAKGDLEHLLKERLMQSAERDKDLNQKLSKALDSLKENEIKVAELAERLETSEAENNNLTAQISKLEGGRQNMQSYCGFEMKAAKDESKISVESVATNKVEYIELQREHESLRHGYNGLKKFLEYLTSTESGIFADDFLGNEDSVGYSSKKQLVKAMEANGDRLHKYDHEIADVEPGIDGTTTQERLIQEVRRNTLFRFETTYNVISVFVVT
ncbi:hypothetical protein P5673_027322 [Acropora cervicornis]|uniref:Uncharacterized protein n=1 Tax=Acropora cervicornis TaxID=6130 RepID=A0AAD9PYX1_ACRCE|nr:hypothetical protein P5673_027322 [Acropora cervicornis]